MTNHETYIYYIPTWYCIHPKPMKTKAEKNDSKKLDRFRRPAPVMPDSPEEVFRAMFRVADRKLSREFQTKAKTKSA